MTPVSIIRQDAVNELAETARQAPPGDLVEVGVYQGGSACALADVARTQGRRLFLFDTFTGIPLRDSARDSHKVGDFADTSIDAVREAIPDAVIAQGVFPLTLTDDVGPIALAHVDCDQYESTLACCKLLGDRMVPGGVMVFDDYDVLPGAKEAVDKIFAGRVEISAQGKARVRF